MSDAREYELALRRAQRLLAAGDMAGAVREAERAGDALRRLQDAQEGRERR